MLLALGMTIKAPISLEHVRFKTTIKITQPLIQRRVHHPNPTQSLEGSFIPETLYLSIRKIIRIQNILIYLMHPHPYPKTKFEIYSNRSQHHTSNLKCENVKTKPISTELLLEWYTPSFLSLYTLSQGHEETCLYGRLTFVSEFVYKCSSRAPTMAVITNHLPFNRPSTINPKTVATILTLV